MVEAGSRKGGTVDTKKFAYSFQPGVHNSSTPAFNPVFNPTLMQKGKSVSNLGLGYNPLPKTKSVLNPVYKYWFIDYLLKFLFISLQCLNLNKQQLRSIYINKKISTFHLK